MMKRSDQWKRFEEPTIFLMVFFLIFGVLGNRMGLANMLNTMMKTAYSLLIETCFYLMAICVLTSALGRLLGEFGVVSILEAILRPLMRPLYNLPGVAALGAVLTFLSDNPAIISLSKDVSFAKYFKKYQLVSLTNFGTAFGMGLVVVAFMASQGFGTAASIVLIGAVAGSIVSTRLMQYYTLKAHPSLDSDVEVKERVVTKEEAKERGVFLRVLNSLLDGGKMGVDLGLAIIPGVLIISTMVMMLTFGPSAQGQFTGAAYEGIKLLPNLADKVDWLFAALLGFHHTELIAFPITSLGAVGAALGIVPRFVHQGLIDGNAIAVFTAMGMCWSGYLSTHTAMLDSLGYRYLTTKAIGAHTIGGLVAGVVAHLAYVGLMAIF